MLERFFNETRCFKKKEIYSLTYYKAGIVFLLH